MYTYIYTHMRAANVYIGYWSTKYFLMAYWPSLITERRGRLVTASYSEDPAFESPSQRPAIFIEIFVVFLSPPGECWDGTLKLGHDRFAPYPSNSSSFTYLPIIDAILKTSIVK
jgi:hypothetical protein